MIAVPSPVCAASSLAPARCSGTACRLLLGTRLGLLESVRLTLNGHNLAAVHQPVNQRHHASGIGKHLVPLFKRPVGGNDRTLVLVTPTDVKRTKVDTFVLVKLFLLLPHAGAIEEKPFKTMT